MGETVRRFGLSLVCRPIMDPRSDSEYKRVIAEMMQEGIGGLVVSDQPEFWTTRQLVTDVVGEMRLPSIYPYREFVDVGGLMAYTVDFPELFRQEAAQISRVLSGAPPGELPFYIATKVQLIINLKTANALGLTIPSALLGRADEVIE